MKRVLFSLLFLSACSPHRTLVKHLGPLPEPAQAPAACELISVLADSPAKKAGLHVGDTILQVNGKAPADASAVSDLIQESPSTALIETKDSAGKIQTVKVALNRERPRLGASCDLTGWRRNSVSAAGNESISVFQGPYVLTLSGIIDKGMTFIRARLTNHTEQPLPISMDLFSVEDAQKQPLKVLSPYEVIYFMHGQDAVPLIKAPVPAKGVTPYPVGVPADSLIRQVAPTHKGKENWSRGDQQYVEANAAYLSKESLWPMNADPGKWGDGLIYFLEPKSLPVTIQVKIEGYTLAARFGTPTPSTRKMTAEQLIQFFESQKKGTALRLTLKNGKVFAGKYSSYDPDNEIVWFDTPSGVVLTTSSFGLKHIVHAEVMTPEAKKQPAETPN